MCSWPVKEQRHRPDSDLKHHLIVLLPGRSTKPGGGHISAANRLDLFHTAELWFGEQLVRKQNFKKCVRTFSIYSNEALPHYRKESELLVLCLEIGFFCLKS